MAYTRRWNNHTPEGSGLIYPMLSLNIWRRSIKYMCNTGLQTPVTARCRYSMVNFLQNPHNRPHGRGMVWLLWFQILIDDLTQSLQFCMSRHVILGPVITSPNYFYLIFICGCKTTFVEWCKHYISTHPIFLSWRYKLNNFHLKYNKIYISLAGRTTDWFTARWGVGVQEKHQS